MANILPFERRKIDVLRQGLTRRGLSQ